MSQANLQELRQNLLNPLARMVPLFQRQKAVYHMADRNPAGMEGFQPRWEVVPAVLGALKTIQLRIAIAEQFYLLAIGGSATVNTLGGFRAQIYDTLKQRRFADRGVQFPNLGAGGLSPSGWFFLRHPYCFDQPQSQILVMLQNMENSSNTIQLVLYGACAPFTGSDGV